ncbi:MAG: c-type cytochrome [Magnetospiraceae bacterium]
MTHHWPQGPHVGTVIVCVVLVVVFSSYSVHAQDTRKPGEIVEEVIGPPTLVAARRAFMKSMKASIDTIGLAIRKKQPIDDTEPRTAALLLAQATAKIPEWFPEGSDAPESEAKPDIWTDSARFTGLADDAAAAAQDLARAARSGDREAFLSNFRALAETCGKCHDNFRARKFR